jgi:hypothetical protein
VVAVQHQRLHLRQQRVVAVDVAPAGLHHADGRVREVPHHIPEEIERREEIRVEDRDQLALRHLQPVVQRPRLVAAPVDPVDVHHVDPLAPQPLHREPRDRLGLVRRVVQHLDLEEVLRVVDLRHRVDQPHRHRGLVEQRELHRHPR